MLKQWALKRRVQHVWQLLIQDGGQLLEIHAGANDNRARHLSQHLAQHLRDEIESILYYPHPLCNGGIVIVLKKEVRNTESVVDAITKAFRFIPPDLSLHCLREDELFELALPAFTWLHVVNRRLLLPFWLKYRGVLLYGKDVRAQLPEPPDPHVLLALHIEACVHFLRNHAILGLLMRNEYLQLIRRLNWQMRCLMSTALLVYSEWDVTIEDVPRRFAWRYQNQELLSTAVELNGLMVDTDSSDEEKCRDAAYEAVWFFERFIRELRRVNGECNP